MRLTGNVTGGLGVTNSYPAVIDVVNDSGAQKTFGGAVAVDSGRTLTLSGVRINGNVTVNSGGRLEMRTSETEFTRQVTVEGVLDMQNGILGSSSTTRVGLGGRLTITAGQVLGKVELKDNGWLTMNGGIFNSPDTKVLSGGRLFIKEGTTIGPNAKVSKNGVLQALSPGSILASDFILVAP